MDNCLFQQRVICSSTPPLISSGICYLPAHFHQLVANLATVYIYQKFSQNHTVMGEWRFYSERGKIPVVCPSFWFSSQLVPEINCSSSHIAILWGLWVVN